MLDSVRRTWGLLSSRQRIAFVMLTIGQLLANLMDLIGIGAVGLLLMAVASGKIDFQLSGFYRLTIDSTPPWMILALVALAAGSFLAKALANLFLSLATIRLLARVEVGAATRAADYLTSGTLAGLSRYSNADIHYLVNSSTSAMFSGVLNSVSTMITSFGLMLTILAGFFLVDPMSAAIITGYLIAIVVLVQTLIGGKLKQLGLDVNRGSVAATSSMLDLIKAFREISVLGRQPFFLKKYSEARKLLADTNARSIVYRSVPRVVIEQGLMLGLLGFIGWQILSGDFSSGFAYVGVFVVGSVRIIGAVVPVQNAYATLKTTVVKAESAQELQQELLEKGFRVNANDGQARSVGPQKKLTVDSVQEISGVSVSLKNVSFFHPGTEKKGVSGISFDIPQGSFIALIGPSGAGKTTLADLILGLNRPETGTIEVAGSASFDLRKTRPGLLSYVPQRPGVVSGTIAENVALGIETAAIDEARVWECLRIAHLEDLIRQLPDGIHSSLGRQTDQLSGGQLQRLGVARAFYSNPRLVVLDEATSALDAGSEAAVSQNIREMGKSVTLIVIAHRLSTIQHADCVYVVDEGKIIASGPFNTLRQTVPMIEEYVRLMSFDDTEG